MKWCKFPWIHRIADLPFDSTDGSLWLERYCSRCYQADFYKRIDEKWVLAEYPSGEPIVKEDRI